MILFTFFEFIGNIFGKMCGNCKAFIILEIIGIIFGLITLFLYILLIPIFPHITIIKLYYGYIKEVREKNENIILIPIIIGEGLIFIISLFSLMIFHYLFLIILLIMGLISLIMRCLYNP